MIEAFKSKLEKLADDPKDDFRERLREMTGPREAVRYEAPLRNMILAMPDMLRRIRRWSDDRETSHALRRLQMFTLAYLYNPEDFLPEKTHGFFGYVDDAYLVTETFLRAIEGTRSAGMNLEDDARLFPNAEAWASAFREILPETAERIDKILMDHIEAPGTVSRWAAATRIRGG